MGSGLRNFTILLLFSSILISCVGKKKHLEAIDQLTKSYELQIADRDSSLTIANQTIRDQELNIAVRQGENNALTAVQDKLLDRIDTLQNEIEELNEETVSLEQNMDQALQQKAQEIAEKEGKLQELKEILEQRETDLNNIAVELQDTLRSLDSLEHSVQNKAGKITVYLTEKLSFVPGSTHRMTKDGLLAFEYISNILQNYPSMFVTITGHTDNRPVPRRSIRDNWEFAAMRAATVVRVMTKDFDISPNRIIATSKGEFAPKVSNETKEGRANNRRIEVAIQPRQEDLAREIRRRID